MKKAIATVDFPSRMTGAVVICLAIQAFIESSGPVELANLMASETLRAFHRFLLRKAEPRFAEYNDDEANYEYIDENEENVAEFIDPNEVDSNFEQQIVQDLEALRDNIITLDDTLITVRFDQVIPLLALATDAMVRYEYEPRAIPSYLLDVLGLSDDS